MAKRKGAHAMHEDEQGLAEAPQEVDCEEVSPNGPVILKPGYYIVRSDRTLLCNPKTGQPTKFSTRAQAVTVAECTGGGAVLIVTENFAWGD